MSSNPRHATPGCLRNRPSTDADMTMTDVGPIRKDIKDRIDLMLESGDLNVSELIVELGIIADYAGHAVKVRAEARQKAKAKQLSAPSTTISEAEALRIAVENYAQTGDLAMIVPEGRFVSDEEKDLWRRVTMVKVAKVAGRTLTATLTSNGKPFQFRILKEGVQGSVGICAAVDNGTLVTALVPLGDDGEDLAQAFNSLYRKK